MARSEQSKEYNTFVKGIITEASALTFPENASIDEDNFVLNRDGSRQRRLGMDFETTAVLKDTALSDTIGDATVFQTFVWESVNNDADLKFGVIRAYNSLWFVDITKDSFSSNFLNRDAGSVGQPISLSIGNELIQVTSIGGKLIVVGPNILPVYLDYDSTNEDSGTPAVTSTTITCEVRDFWGIADGYDVDERRPAGTETASHKYNCFNQGWYETTTESASGPTNIAYTKMEAKTGTYPSNADVWTIFKTPDNYLTFNSNQEYQHALGNTAAPKGHYILDAFNRSTSRNLLSGITVPTDTEAGRFSTVTSFAGRLFFSGIDSDISGGDAESPTYANYVFFTKLVNNENDFGRFYQEADPTSENISDIIDTDGGYVVIPDMAKCLRIVATEASLMIFGTNGVWELTGGTEGGFLATDYKVRKITDVGASSAASIVYVEGSILYWSLAGIYVLSPDQVAGTYRAQNITETTIQSLYNNIPSNAKTYAQGYYDPKSRKIFWGYNNNENGEFEGNEYRSSFNRELIFDTVLQAFYTNTVSVQSTGGVRDHTTPFICGYLPTNDFLISQIEEGIVTDAGEIVITDGAETVYTLNSVRTQTDAALKYLTLKYDTSSLTYDFTFSAYTDSTFVDWASDADGSVSYDSYLVTGYELGGSSTRDKQATYVWFHFDRTEDGYELDGTGNLVLKNPSGCLVTPRWEWSDSSNSGRWGTQFQAYRFRRNYIPSGPTDPFDYGFSVITTKNKLRGSGKALSLRIDSEAGKDMRLLGWSTDYTAGSK